MKKVTFVRKKKNPFGGAERYFDRLIKELERRSYSIEILHLPPPRWLPAWIQALHYNFTACLKKNGRFYFSIDRLTCLDVHRAGGGVHRAYLQTRKKSLNPLHPIYLWIEKRTFQKAKRIIAISKMVKKQIVEHYKIPESKITVIYNGIEFVKVDDKRLQNSKKQLSDEFGIPPNIPIILFVGSGFRRKGVDDFLEIISQVKKPFHAFIVGKESRMHRYRNKARILGISDRVTFTGPRRDVQTFYSAADIFLFPTHYEPFGNVILEAMNFYNVVITTHQCGGGELIDPNWRMSSPKDRSITEKIENLLNHPSQMIKIKMNNYHTAAEYTIAKNVNETLEVIESAMKECP